MRGASTWPLTGTALRSVGSYSEYHRGPSNQATGGIAPLAIAAIASGTSGRP